MTTQLPITEEAFFTIACSCLIVNSFFSGWFFGTEYKESATPTEKAKTFAGCFIAFVFGSILILIWFFWSMFDLIFNQGNSLARDPEEDNDPDKDGPFTSSLVKCDLCGRKWRAVRPKGTPKLQCPACDNITFFEDVEF